MIPLPQLITLTFLTFNFWGLPDLGFRVLSPLRTERAEELCRRFSEVSKKREGWDVIFLQEVWVAEDRARFTHCGYSYVADEEDDSLPLDSGLMILSRYPLAQVQRYTYPMQAGMGHLTEDGEGLARKSALVALVNHPMAGAIWVANTHLVSDYRASSGGNDTYLELRRQQFSAFLSWTEEVSWGRPLVIGGDWNFGPKDPLWDELRPTLAQASEAPGADQAATLAPPNTMHAVTEGKVDHLFGLQGAVAHQGGIALTAPLKVDDLSISLSDHWGFSTNFSFSVP
jgi:endonuclease/exonuclease/phosphatase family metal-dependent hydrolase